MYVPPFPKDTQSLMTQFNHLLKNNCNLRIQKKNDKLGDDTTFDLSGSSFENDNIDNSFNSLYKENHERNCSCKRDKG